MFDDLFIISDPIIPLEKPNEIRQFDGEMSDKRATPLSFQPFKYHAWSLPANVGEFVSIIHTTSAGSVLTE